MSEPRPTRETPDQRATFESFGYEWNTFDRIQPEDEVFWERYFADVDRDWLRNKVVLDAGCGKGRFAYFTAPLVGWLCAVDGSDAVQAAARNLSSFHNTAVIKGDLLSPPFPAERFDLVFCLGVIHHLPDPRRGFAEICRLVRPGGRLLLYVYSRPTGWGARRLGLAGSSALRRLTIHLPHPVLRALAAPLAALLYAVFVLPGRAGGKLGISPLERLPLQTYRGRPLRSLWLDTFDRLSAPLEARYTWDDISPWFDEEGMKVVSRRDDAGLIVLADKRL